MNNGYASLLVNGMTVGLKWGLPAIRQIGEKSAFIKIADTTTGQYTELGIAHILYAGYVNNCLIKDEMPAKLKFEPFYDLVFASVKDSASLEQIVEAMKVFEASKEVQEIIAAGQEQSKKKNGHGTKLKSSVTVS